MPRIVLDDADEQLWELLEAEHEYEEGREEAEPECRCYCVGDQADASDCQLHGFFKGIKSHPAETPDEDPF